MNEDVCDFSVNLEKIKNEFVLNENRLKFGKRNWNKNASDTHCISYLIGCFIHFGSHVSQILNDFLRVLSLASTWLTSTENRLIFALSQHWTIRLVGYGEHMWRHFVSLFAFVQFDYFLRVNGQIFVRINNNTKKTRICLNKDATFF